jgi:hypothetical protein
MLATVDHLGPYRRVRIPDEQNALPLWEQAIGLSVEVEERPSDEQQTCSADGGDCCPRSWKDEEPGLPRNEEGARLLVGIEQNRRALDLLDAGIMRGRLQLPEIPSPEEFGVGLDVVRGLRNLACVRFLRIRRQVGQGRFDDSVRDALRLLEQGDMICNGEGIVLHYMCGSLYRRMGIDAIWFVAKQNPPERSLVELLAGVERSLSCDDGLATAVQIDFWRTVYPAIERVPDGADLEQLVDHLLNTLYTNSPCEWLDDEVVDAEERAAWRRRALLEALDGHPLRFDKQATLQQAEIQLQRAINSLTSPPLASKFDPRGWMRRMRERLTVRQHNHRSFAWGFQLSPSCAFKYLGEGETVRANLDGFRSMMDANMHLYFRPITLEAIGQVRRRLRRIRNPIGMLLIDTIGSDTLARPMMLNSGSRLAGTKTMLAASIYRIRNGKLPDTLGDLLKERIITSLPVDPYSGRALKYDPRRAAVWCVGEKGVNRRGDLAHEPYGRGHQLRWKIPSTVRS